MPSIHVCRECWDSLEGKQVSKYKTFLSSMATLVYDSTSDCAKLKMQDNTERVCVCMCVWLMMTYSAQNKFTV